MRDSAGIHAQDETRQGMSIPAESYNPDKIMRNCPMSAIETLIIPRTRDLGDGFEVRRALPAAGRRILPNTGEQSAARLHRMATGSIRGAAAGRGRASGGRDGR